MAVSGRVMSAADGVDTQPFFGVPGYLTRDRMHLSEEITYEEWCRVGMVLRFMEQGVHWWLGDWWRFGERHYGEMATQASQDAIEDVTGYSYQTVLNDAWVASRFEPSRRRENLSFSHHAEVASLDADDADVLLTRAESEGWSRRDLREHVKWYRPEPEDGPSPALRQLQDLRDRLWKVNNGHLAKELPRDDHREAHACVQDMDQWISEFRRYLVVHGEDPEDA